mgnify:CR=1 FL=1
MKQRKKTNSSNFLYTVLANVFKFRLFKNELDRKIKTGIIIILFQVLFFIIWLKYSH